MPKGISRYSVGLAPALHPDGPYIVVVSATQKPYPGDNDQHYADLWACQARSAWLSLSTKEREQSAGTPPSPRQTTPQPVPQASAPTADAPPVDEGGGETDHPPIVVETVAAMVTESARAVACPTCKAQPGQPCVRPSGQEIQGYDVHSPRAKAWAAQQARAAKTVTPEEGAA